MRHGSHTHTTPSCGCRSLFAPLGRAVKRRVSERGLFASAHGVWSATSHSPSRRDSQLSLLGVCFGFRIARIRYRERAIEADEFPDVRYWTVAVASGNTSRNTRRGWTARQIKAQPRSASFCFTLLLLECTTTIVLAGVIANGRPPDLALLISQAMPRNTWLV